MKAPRTAAYGLLALLVTGGVYYYCFVFKASPKLASPPKLEAVLPKNFVAAMNGGPGQPVQTAGTNPAPAAAENPAVKITGNGSDHFDVTIKNTGRRPVVFALHAGEIYDNGKNRVVLLEGYDHQIPAGGAPVQISLRTAALSSANAPDGQPYAKSTVTVPNLDVLMQKAQDRPDITRETLQTAILALAENPAVDVFAKFPRLHGGPSPGSDSFKVDTADIISAMQLLSDCGVNDRVAATDPQLEIEAMIDPKSHESAMRYFGITPEEEWAYWKHELLEGNPATRHYALYGIAQYYPDVALIMLPKWAKEGRLKPIYRLSAVRALAMTNRQEAIVILLELEQAFSPETDLHQSANRAAKYLSSHFNQPSPS